ncbi:MAG TPA: Hsp20/alpha crystallin family protein [Gaiellaceae bacterium]|nr:Hsp20/alpha crystallin family protein [Gaiellaceae bacterium]
MQVVRWTPFQELEAFERRMQRLFDERFGALPVPLPAADVFERGDEFVVELEVPGFEEKELEIQVTDHTLVVSGRRAEEKEDEEKAYHRRERLEKSFERRFALPPEADVDAVTADFEKGVLEIHAPKLQAAKPRTVEIGKES